MFCSAPPHPAPRFLLSMLEHVVLFLLSQSTCCLAYPPPALEGGRQELLARELASELVGEAVQPPGCGAASLSSTPSAGNLPLRDVSLLLPPRWALPLSWWTAPHTLATQVPQSG